MTSNILSPVEKMSSEHLATTRQKLEYIFSIRDQLNKMFQEKEKAYKEIEKDKYIQHFWPGIKIAVDNAMSVLLQTVSTELIEVFGNGFDIRTLRFDEDMTRALQEVHKRFPSLSIDGNSDFFTEFFAKNCSHKYGSYRNYRFYSKL
ncbi:hypothetical protein TNCV_3980581 [Trichonephila clavipes]|nr:hypothetical protein TNCV_3980581 [Trichonephila clavipes]